MAKLYAFLMNEKDARDTAQNILDWVRQYPSAEVRYFYLMYPTSTVTLQMATAWDFDGNARQKVGEENCRYTDFVTDFLRNQGLNVVPMMRITNDNTMAHIVMKIIPTKE